MKAVRRHLNTLYVTTENAWLRKDGENAVVKVGGDETGRVPLHLLGGIVCFGAVGVSPALIGRCAELGVRISLMGRNGRFLARIEGPVSGNVLLRRSQYRTTDNPGATATLAQNMVAGKILNQRTALQRTLRDHGSRMPPTVRDRLEDTARRLKDAARRAMRVASVDALRGVEGEAARLYYSTLGDMVRRDDEVFAFARRSRRPPMDPLNALLSFLYVLLTHDCRSALETTGLDPAVGFLHRERPGRPSLALDLMEELRPILADRVALSLVNRRQLGSRDFTKALSGAVLLADDARKKVLTVYQERKRDELKHPFLEEKTTLGLVPFIQATLLARCLRGDLDGYPPFLWR